MADIKFIDKNPISLATLAEELKAVEEKKDKVAVQQQVKDYAIRFSKVNKVRETKLTKTIKDLEVPLLTDTHIVQIVNLMPGNLTELQTIFAGSKTNVSAENLDKIQKVIKAHGK